MQSNHRYVKTKKETTDELTKTEKSNFHATESQVWLYIV